MAIENSITEVAETSLEFEQQVITMRKSVIQYEAREILEYWLIEHPERQVVLILTLKDGSYQEAMFSGRDRITSTTFQDFSLTAEQVLNPSD